ncbi:bZIP transcription factor family protein [Brugia malayi]|uniref:X-box-binding protein 1 n=1 Tax=Brugia malayi TaxID=6279 RepID=A0A4E9F6G8_BRUMA|nr:bZIP transcription factor family protein [Brugia malayi]VIO92413.1 bZIP transcription factor family protein [Brugia malayi]
MSVYILHPQTVATPSYSSTILKTRNVSAPILPRYCTARPLTVVGRQSLRTVIPVQDVQRSAKTSVLQQPIEELLGLEASGEHTVRKRERLNHLTAEEKQNRRKLKNRVAAQTARDRKKYRASKLEEAVRMLILENSKLREENKCLKKTCEELKSQNVELENLLNNNRERDECSETEVTSSSNTASSSLGSAESIRGPQQREQAVMRSLPILMLFCLVMKCRKSSGKSAQLMEQIRRCKMLAERHLNSSDSVQRYLPQTPISPCTDTAINNAVEYEESASCVNFNMESDHESNCEQLSGYSFCASKSSDTTEHFTPSSPSFILFDDIKEGNNDTPSLLISDNDPITCTHCYYYFMVFIGSVYLVINCDSLFTRMNKISRDYLFHFFLF